MGTVEQQPLRMKVFIYISSLVAAISAQYARPVVAHAAPVIAHAAPVYAHAAPVVHAAPVAAYHAPVVAHAAEVYADEVSPYTYNYAVADDYSNSNFQATESDDGTGVREGGHSVALPDGRIQHVNYHANDLDGFVAEVTYEGTAAYPEAAVVAHAPVGYARPVVHAAPLVAHAAPLIAHAPLVAHASPVYRGAGQTSHQSVSKPYQGEHRSTSQAKAFGASVATVADRPNALHGAHSRNLGVLSHGIGHAVIG